MKLSAFIVCMTPVTAATWAELYVETFDRLVTMRFDCLAFSYSAFHTPQQISVVLAFAPGTRPATSVRVLGLAPRKKNRSRANPVENQR